MCYGPLYCLSVKNKTALNRTIAHKTNSYQQRRSEINMDYQAQSKLFSQYPDILNAKDLRQILGIGRAGVYKLLEAGEIQSFKIGNAYKIPKGALIDYVRKQCHM